MKIVILGMLMLIISCRENLKENEFDLQSEKGTIDSLRKDSSQVFLYDLSDTIGGIIKKRYNLHQISLLGSFKNPLDNKIFMFEGFYTDETFQEKSMYVARVNKKTDSVMVERFSLSGREYNYLDLLVYESRIFYGNCLIEFPCSIVWYQKELMKDNTWKTVFFILDVSSDEWKTHRFGVNEIDLNSIYANLAQKKCFELPAQEIYDEP